MANLYWVGVTGQSWNTASNWSFSSGGQGGAGVPTSADDVFFDLALTRTVLTNGTITCRNCTVSAGTYTFSKSGGTWEVYGSISFTSGAQNWPSGSFPTNFKSTSTGNVINTNGISFQGTITFDGVGGAWTLGSALIGGGSVVLTNGSFDTANYSVNLSSFSSSNTNTRSLSLNASTITNTGTINAWLFGTTTNLTFSAGTSTILFFSGGNQITFNGGGLTYYNVTVGGFSTNYMAITGANTFNDLTISPNLSSSGTFGVSVSANQTIGGTLSVPAQADPSRRVWFYSDAIGTSRTLTCAAVSLTDADFISITIAGAAAPASGTRLGDGKGNSGITFGAGKTVYVSNAGATNWGSSNGWSSSAGGAPDSTQFPLAQDTVVFTSSYPTASTITFNARYLLGTLDMSARTASFPLTLAATGAFGPYMCGNWINGGGVTTNNTSSRLVFIGRTTQTFTSSGKIFSGNITVASPGGSLVLQDALTLQGTGTASVYFPAIPIGAGTLAVNNGTFDANNYNVTFTAAGTDTGLTASLTTEPRTVAIGSGTWTIACPAQAGTGTPWNCAISTNLTVTGTGTISLSSNAGSKTFAGGDIQTYPTLNNAGFAPLTVSGSNKFANMTNTAKSTAATTIRFTAGTTNEFTAFNVSGEATRLCTLGSSTTSQATLKKATQWYMGANSTNGGNNTNLTFTAGDNIDYLSVSYILGLPAPLSRANFFMLFN